MSISVQSLANEKARRFGVSPSSTTFQQTFIDSLNYVLGDINALLGLSTAAVSEIEGTIDLTELTYRGTISLGVDHYFADDSIWTTKDPRVVEAQYRRKLGGLHVTYMQTQSLYPKKGDLD